MKGTARAQNLFPIQMLPSISSTSFEIESPRPVPVLPRGGAVGLAEGLEQAGRLETDVIPMPVSRTENLRFTLSRTFPRKPTVTGSAPCSVNFYRIVGVGLIKT